MCVKWNVPRTVNSIICWRQPASVLREQSPDLLKCIVLPNRLSPSSYTFVCSRKHTHELARKSECWCAVCCANNTHARSNDASRAILFWHSANRFVAAVSSSGAKLKRRLYVFMTDILVCLRVFYFFILARLQSPLDDEPYYRHRVSVCVCGASMCVCASERLTRGEGFNKFTTFRAVCHHLVTEMGFTECMRAWKCVSARDVDARRGANVCIVNRGGLWTPLVVLGDHADDDDGVDRHAGPRFTCCTASEWRVPVVGRAE